MKSLADRRDIAPRICLTGIHLAGAQGRLFSRSAKPESDGSPGNTRRHLRETVPANTRLLVLTRDNYLKLAGAAGTQLICRDGKLWITEEGGRDDVLLMAGERFTIHGHGVTMVSALSPSTLSILGPSAAA